MELSNDAFLGGGLTVSQPLKGHHRAGLDAVFLAAAADPVEGGLVVELGAGVGVASLCLARRRPDILVQMVERDRDLVDLARRNIAQNATFADPARLAVVEIDLTLAQTAREAVGLRANGADAVILNPPFYSADRVRASDQQARRAAHVLEADGLDPWFKCAAALLKAKGVMTLIFPAEGLADCLNGMAGRFGGAGVFPLFARSGRPATKVLISAVKGSRAPLRLHQGMVLHGDGERGFTPAAEAVLRHGQAIVW